MSAPAATTTAHWIAAARARESARPDRLFDDPLAGALAGDRGRQMLERSERGTGENAFLAVRTRYFDDLLTAWVGAGGRQVVLLGAGLDTRAFRLPLPGDTHVLELDHPELLAEKDEVLAGLGATARCRRSVVAADFTRPWIAALRTAGFDPTARTLWLTEGLLYHLTTPDVDDLLRTTAALSPSGSTVAADLSGTGLRELPDVRAAHDQRPQPFCHDDPEELFAAAGWSAVDAVPVGSERASFGRLSGRTPGGDPTMRSYLVSATR
jgi:methyltransferase (TIGR00027 family)